jgi:hypothetical protein
LAGVEDGLHLIAERRAGLDSGAKNVTGRDVGEAVALAEELALGALTGALFPQDDKIELTRHG